MGLFSGMAKAKVIARRGNDEAGTYLQVIDKLEEKESRKKQPYLQVSKTVIHAYDGTLRPGAEIQQALGPWSDYYLQDVKKLIVAALGLEAEQAAELDDDTVVNPEAPAREQKTKAEVLVEQIVGDGLLNGAVVEVKVESKPSSKLGEDGKPKFFTNVYYQRRVGADEVKETLGPENFKKFFPKGLT